MLRPKIQVDVSQAEPDREGAPGRGPHKARSREELEVPHVGGREERGRLKGSGRPPTGDLGIAQWVVGSSRGAGQGYPLVCFRKIQFSRVSLA